MTSACTYSVASSPRSSADATEHVPRPRTGAHTHGHAEGEADRRARRRRNSSRLVFLRHNKHGRDREAADSAIRIPRSGAERSGEGRREAERGSEGGGSSLTTLGAKNKDSCHHSTTHIPNTDSGEQQWEFPASSAVTGLHLPTSCRQTVHFSEKGRT